MRKSALAAILFGVGFVVAIWLLAVALTLLGWPVLNWH
jgi:hypothetical protein